MKTTRLRSQNYEEKFGLLITKNCAILYKRLRSIG